MSPKVEKISENYLVVGEGPHWDDRTHALYFVDVLQNSIHKYDATTGAHTSTKVDGRPGFIVPVDGHLDQFVVGLDREFVIVQWDGAADSAANVVRVLGETDPQFPMNRINDGKADPKGRLYAGTMDGSEDRLPHDHQGTLYRLDESSITALVHKITIANGLAWDLAAKAMYYIDSSERNIRRYDYDVDTGDISNPRHIFDLKAHGVEGFADGCTIDTDGNLWVAVWGSGSVIQVSPKGELLRQVPVPAKQVTSCTFGGPNLDILFVTTARLVLPNIEDFKEEQKYPSGCTFQITNLGVKGHPNVTFKL